MNNISVAYAAGPLMQIEISLTVSSNCSVAAAIKQSGILTQFPEIELNNAIKVGIYGKLVNLDAVVKDGERVEIYRPLQLDPKQARVLRANLKK